MKPQAYRSCRRSHLKNLQHHSGDSTEDNEGTQALLGSTADNSGRAVGTGAAPVAGIGCWAAGLCAARGPDTDLGAAGSGLGLGDAGAVGGAVVVVSAAGLGWLRNGNNCLGVVDGGLGRVERGRSGESALWTSCFSGMCLFARIVCGGDDFGGNLADGAVSDTRSAAGDGVSLGHLGGDCDLVRALAAVAIVTAVLTAIAIITIAAAVAAVSIITTVAIIPAVTTVAIITTIAIVAAVATVTVVTAIGASWYCRLARAVRGSEDFGSDLTNGAVGDSRSAAGDGISLGHLGSDSSLIKAVTTVGVISAIRASWYRRLLAGAVRGSKDFGSDLTNSAAGNGGSAAGNGISLGHLSSDGSLFRAVTAVGGSLGGLGGGSLGLDSRDGADGNVQRESHSGDLANGATGDGWLAAGDGTSRGGIHSRGGHFNGRGNCGVGPSR